MYSYIPIAFILVMSSCFMMFKHIRSISAYSHLGADRIYISTRHQKMGQMFEHPIFYLFQDDCRHIYIYTMIYIYIILHLLYETIYISTSVIYISTSPLKPSDIVRVMSLGRSSAARASWENNEDARRRCLEHHTRGGS